MKIDEKRYLKLSIPDRQKKVRSLLEDVMIGLTIFSLGTHGRATEFNAKTGRPLHKEVTAEVINETLQVFCTEINSLIREINLARAYCEAPDPVPPKEKLVLELCAKHHGERSDS